MDVQLPDSPAPEPVRFRAGKKRKAVYRQRSPSPTAVATLSPRSEHGADAADSDQDDSAVAAALRARNAQKARQRAAGVGFRSDSRPEQDDADDRALVRRETQDEAPVMAIGSRFMHQTGLLTDLNDRHMTAYIESRLSNRASASGTSSPHPNENQPSSAAAQAKAKPVDQSAMQGKLMEVDIAELARPRQASNNGDRAAKKPRLGKDGKPWRGRNRRNSEDMKRDKLVEEFLHENRLDVYEQPTASPAAGAVDSSTTADDRLAEEFQRQYMDDMEARRKRKRPTQPAASSSKQAGPVAEDVLKGPRLGGSRNARAAVRDALLKKEKEGKR